MLTNQIQKMHINATYFVHLLLLVQVFHPFILPAFSSSVNKLV